MHNFRTKIDKILDICKKFSNIVNEKEISHAMCS